MCAPFIPMPLHYFIYRLLVAHVQHPPWFITTSSSNCKIQCFCCTGAQGTLSYNEDVDDELAGLNQEQHHCKLKPARKEVTGKVSVRPTMRPIVRDVPRHACTCMLVSKEVPGISSSHAWTWEGGTRHIKQKCMDVRGKM